MAGRGWRGVDEAVCRAHCIKAVRFVAENWRSDQTLSIRASSSRAIRGDWMGSSYWLGGERSDWHLCLRDDGAFASTVTDKSGKTTTNGGKWQTEENERVLVLVSDNGSESRWVIRDIAGMEGANTLLILRLLILGSRNLPIMLYRVHLRSDS